MKATVIEGIGSIATVVLDHPEGETRHFEVVFDFDNYEVWNDNFDEKEAIGEWIRDNISDYWHRVRVTIVNRLETIGRGCKVVYDYNSDGYLFEEKAVWFDL